MPIMPHQSLIPSPPFLYLFIYVQNWPHHPSLQSDQTLNQSQITIPYPTYIQEVNKVQVHLIGKTAAS